MKKLLIVVFGLQLLLLFIGCKTKEERQIIGEWKLVDIKATLPNAAKMPHMETTAKWAYYLEEGKSLTFVFNRDETFIFIEEETFTFAEQDIQYSNIETGKYYLRNVSDGELMLRLIWDYTDGDYRTGNFYDVILEKQKMCFKQYLTLESDYFTHIFKKVK
jgi:hypothetical protein